ncbi:MAG: hypothetical protein ABI091_15950 [Ferruginibacter sp.]
MKKNYFITVIALFAATALSAQIRTMTPAMKTKVLTTTAKPLPVHVESAKPNTPPPVNKDIQSASISFTNGDDGKERYTQVGAQVWNNNRSTAAYFNMNFDNVGRYIINNKNSAEYFAGTTVTEPMVTGPGIPTGEIKMVGTIPIPVCRMATELDFSNGGELRIDIIPADAHNDIWKIQKIRLRIIFNNDNASPRTITWDNITLSSTKSPYIDLLFDKNFNAIQ